MNRWAIIKCPYGTNRWGTNHRMDRSGQTARRVAGERTTGWIVRGKLRDESLGNKPRNELLRSKLENTNMDQPFDPYHTWLGIPPEEQPPHHYRLLGIKPFEEKPAVIESAADRQMAHLRSFQSGNTCCWIR